MPSFNHLSLSYPLSLFQYIYSYILNYLHKYERFSPFFQKKRVIREFYSEFLFSCSLTKNPKLLRLYHTVFRKTSFSFIFFTLKIILVKSE